MDVVDSDMGLKVTDSGLSALASAGCGTQLTSLTLRGGCLCMILVQLAVGGEYILIV